MRTRKDVDVLRFKVVVGGWWIAPLAMIVCGLILLIWSAFLL